MEFLSGFLESIFLEQVVHGRIREGYSMGLFVSGLGVAAAFLVYLFFGETHSKVFQASMLVCMGVCLIGSWIQVKNDIADQESGNFSKFGSGWNLWGDNILSNYLGQYILTVAIIGCFAYSFWTFAEASQAKKAVLSEKGKTKHNASVPKKVIRKKAIA